MSVYKKTCEFRWFVEEVTSKYKNHSLGSKEDVERRRYMDPVLQQKYINMDDGSETWNRIEIEMGDG